MNFCKNCKYVDKGLWYWCSHPAVLKHNYIENKTTNGLCILVRGDKPECKLFEKKETFWEWVNSLYDDIFR